MAAIRICSQRWAPAISSLRCAALAAGTGSRHGAPGRACWRSVFVGGGALSRSRGQSIWKCPPDGFRCAGARRALRVSAAAAQWKEDESPYETLGVSRDVEDDEIKAAYRRMAKQFHPDVYDNSKELLEEGETAESKFIRIQAAYELLMDRDQRRQYDLDHRINPMQASRAWMDWVMKKKKAFEQRGDMAASVWAEQQQREMSLKARRLARHKVDPEEERRILAKERQASLKNFETTVNRHTLVLKKRELNRRKADEAAKAKLVQQLLAAEGLELDDERF
ncbi:hypothetical protein MPTK1_1g27600 [Marchantia polymorpha subsp. ruderalis]|uniref:J domain-containing protein n=2 Tax=Marchantia polymorpha TaxID=3197 RepID=A0AAF6AUX1_MARPO|nr:hypothetical protein MARPO_0002s0118 [Marchantia polymorpha]BBN00242.1 hypothetical protein Mp_1g27600 [Marchantia polymorpha subsp. ruderalis]|eukprot:PTQ49642.1 hypothetical protein MARPO_0002s0118 [Marchantia polymorpha]